MSNPRRETPTTRTQHHRPHRSSAQHFKPSIASDEDQPSNPHVLTTTYLPEAEEARREHDSRHRRREPRNHRHIRRAQSPRQHETISRRGLGITRLLVWILDQIEAHRSRSRHSHGMPSHRYHHRDGLDRVRDRDRVGQDHRGGRQARDRERRRRRSRGPERESAHEDHSARHEDGRLRTGDVKTDTRDREERERRLDAADSNGFHNHHATRGRSEGRSLRGDRMSDSPSRQIVPLQTIFETRRDGKVDLGPPTCRMMPSRTLYWADEEGRVEVPPK